MGRETPCEVLARRLGVFPAPVYSECTVVGAPWDLPDGEYAVEFENIRAVATRHLGVRINFDPPLGGNETPATHLE